MGRRCVSASVATSVSTQQAMPFCSGLGAMGLGLSLGADQPPLSTGNLAWRTSWQDLKDKFREVGTVVYANVVKDDGGRSKGWGIVEFETPEEVRRCHRTGFRSLHCTFRAASPACRLVSDSFSGCCARAFRR